MAISKNHVTSIRPATNPLTSVLTAPLQRSLRKQIHACWYGKAIGGTLGGPVEGQPGPLALTYYDPVPETALPNDDLDLQVVWLHHLRTQGCREVTPEILAEAWERHVRFPFDEYAVSLRNRKWGLSGPAQGGTDNVFAECMGGAIRSEVWACIAPGDPKRAAAFAWADAVVDHTGDGVWAEVFNATLQSAAFVESNRENLIEIALSSIPAESRLYSAVRDTCAWWADSGDWHDVRDQVLNKYADGNFTYVVINLCFQMIGWFDGDGDFGRSICTATNCGMDTDCTAATLGALLGILSPDSLPEKWTRPIGESVVLSPEIVGVTVPRDLSELTDWTIEVAAQLADYTPAIQPVPENRPSDASSPGVHWPARFQQLPTPDRTESQSPLPDMARANSTTLHGAWTRWDKDATGPHGIALSIPFQTPLNAPIKLMVFYRPGAQVWLDDRAVLTVDAATIAADTFCAPSFHRSGPAGVVLPALHAGKHVLTIRLNPPADTQAVDLVWGFADPVTNQWAIEIVPLA